MRNFQKVEIKKIEKRKRPKRKDSAKQNKGKANVRSSTFPFQSLIKRSASQKIGFFTRQRVLVQMGYACSASGPS